MGRRKTRRTDSRRSTSTRRRPRPTGPVGFERLEARVALTVDVASAAQLPALLPKIHVSHFGQDIPFTNRDGLTGRQIFQQWASDYISFLTNSGASVAYINIGDYLQDQKGAYSYLNPSLGTNNVPWIVTDFLDRLPEGVEAGVIAYLDVANPWTLFDANNQASNVSTTDGRAGSPPKNNVYQAFQLVNAVNAAQVQSGGTKFFTHFQADGEGAGAFESDSYYGFGATPVRGTPYSPAGNQPQPSASWTTPSDWPTAGYGYIKWLWNHFMPGVTAADVAPGGVALPASATVPDVVFTDAEAIDSATWSTGAESPYKFGIIKYAQTSWLNYSPGPMLAYTENYWFGENHYMPGPGSAIAPDGFRTINYVQTPILNAPTVANDFPNAGPDGPAVTFNTPAGGTAAQGYAVMGTGSIDQTTFSSFFHDFFGGSGVGQGYSPGAWVTNYGSGYTAADQGSPTNLNVIFTPQGGDTPTRVATGYVDTVEGGQIKSITIKDPGAGYTHEPLISIHSATGSGVQAVALILASDGYPTISFPNTGTVQATAYLQVNPQSNKPGAINNVVLQNPGSGYPYSPIDTKAANPLASTTGLQGTFSSTPAPTPYLSQILPANTGFQAAAPLYAPVTSTTSQVDSIVVTVLGDHYDTGPNKPYYTLAGDPANTKHYLTGGALKNGVGIDYNAAYVPPLTLAGSFFVDDSGVSGVTVLKSGMGYGAGAVVVSGGSGYDSSTTYPVTFPAPAAAGGRSASGFLNLNADGNVIGITVTDPGSGYVAGEDGTTFSLPGPGGTGGTAGTAKAYLSNYPTATIAAGSFGPNGGTPARAFVITGPTDPKNPQNSDPRSGYIVTGIGFTYPGVGYAEAPSITISQPPAALGNSRAVVQALPALASKYTAAQLPTIKEALGTPQAAIRGGANAYNWEVSNGYGPGQATGVTITAGGSGYSTAPTVAFSAPPTGGRRAQGIAAVSGGVVTKITITQPGYGYDPANPPTVTIAGPGGGGTQATGIVQLGDVMVVSKAAVNTVYDFYQNQPELLAAMFDEVRYQDVALPKLREAFYWPLLWNSFDTPAATDGTKTPQQAIATFSIESLNRSNAFDADGNYVAGQNVRTSLDSKYQTSDALSVPNTIGGTFAGLSSLSYESFVTFLNTAATIIADKAPKAADGTPTMRPQDVTFQVYDAAFLPVEWLTAQNANRWANQNEAPRLVGGTKGSVPENAPASRVIYTARATDIGATAADRTLTYSLKQGLGDDAARLTIDPRYGDVRLRAPANYESKSTYTFTVVVSDGGTPALSAEQAVGVSVLDLLEAPSAPQLALPAAISVVEDTPTRILFGGTPFSDDDSPAARPMTVTLRVPDGRIIAASALGVTVGGAATARTFTGTVGALNAFFTDPRGHVTYHPAADAASDRPLAVVIRESVGGLASRAEVTLRLVAVNDAPRVRANTRALVVRQGRPSSLDWAAATRAVTDVDSPVVTVTLAVGAGTLQAPSAPAAGVVVTGAPSGRLDFSGSPRALAAYFANAGRVRFTAAPGDASPQTLRITADDGAMSTSITRQIRIVAAPRPPQIGPVVAFAAVRGVPTPLTFSGNPFSDPDASAGSGQRLTVTLTVADGEIVAPSGGGVVVGGTQRIRTFTGTVVDLNRYFTVASPGIRYTPASVAVGTRPLGITIAKRVTEAGGAGRTLTTTIWTAIDVA